MEDYIMQAKAQLAGQTLDPRDYANAAIRAPETDLTRLNRMLSENSEALGRLIGKLGHHIDRITDAPSAIQTAVGVTGAPISVRESLPSALSTADVIAGKLVDLEQTVQRLATI